MSHVKPSLGQVSIFLYTYL